MGDVTTQGAEKYETVKTHRAYEGAERCQMIHFKHSLTAALIGGGRKRTNGRPLR